MIFISCDPGLTGAISLLRPGHGLLECADLPTCDNGQASGKMKRWLDCAALEDLLGFWSDKHGLAPESWHCVLERPIAMPTLPAQTVASQFDTFGALRAIMGRRADVLTIANPKDWGKFFGLGGDKEASRACCLRLYPSAPVGLKKFHNRAESILLGHWAMRTLA